MSIDENFHSPVRFAIMASLVSVDKAEFAFVRDAIEVSDSVLSKQATALEAVGYLQIIKGHVGRRPRTWFALTPQGRAAFAGTPGSPAVTRRSGRPLRRRPVITHPHPYPPCTPKSRHVAEPCPNAGHRR